MNTRSTLGAVALSALLLAACGDEDEGRVADYDDEPFQAKDSDEDFNDGLSGALGDADNPVSTDTQVAQEEGEWLDPTLVTLSEVRIPSDVEALVDNSFERADVNDDGVLSGEEYLAVAPALGQSDNNIGQPGGDEPGGTAMGTGDTADDEMPDGWEPAGRDTFIAEAAGDDMALDREEMQTAFMTRYEAADMDGNDKLEGDELPIYGRLAMAVPE